MEPAVEAVEHDEDDFTDVLKCPKNQEDIMDGTYEDSCYEDGAVAISLLDLPWEDILLKYILPCLPLKTLFQLRGVCHGFKDLVTFHFSKMKTINVSQVAFRMTADAFKIVTEDSDNIEAIIARNAKDWLSSQLLIPVLKKNHKLLKFDVSNCMSVSNACLQVLAINCKNIQELYLRQCHWVSVEGVRVIASNCHSLQMLDLTACWNVNDEAVILLALSCNKLKYLSLAKIYGVTDYAVSVLAKATESIEHLNVQGCWRLSDDSVRDLAEYTHSLKALQVRECRDITETSLARLRLRNVKIDKLAPPHMRGLSTVRHRLNVQI